MKPYSLSFAGMFAVFAFSWFGMVVVPQYQLADLQPQVGEDPADVYPLPAPGLAERGSQVYLANGCVYCHTQVVRSETNGNDIQRGWGKRRSVPRDYIYENPVALGYLRFGPDLGNIGSPELMTDGAPRRPDATWHFLHLYSPRSMRKKSLMPPYPFLFEKRRITGQPSQDALPVTGPDAPPPGYEIVPTPDAKALVAYLLSLDRGRDLKEAKASPLAKLATEGGTP